jgi:hypothetical protein
MKFLKVIFLKRFFGMSFKILLLLALNIFGVQGSYICPENVYLTAFLCVT